MTLLRYYLHGRFTVLAHFSHGAHCLIRSTKLYFIKGREIKVSMLTSVCVMIWSTRLIATHTTGNGDFDHLDSDLFFGAKKY